MKLYFSCTTLLLLLLTQPGSAFISPHSTVTKLTTQLHQSSPALTARALDVFSKLDIDHSSTISHQEFGNLLTLLEMDASEQDALALFKYLDTDQDGEIDMADFLPWYEQAAEASQEMARSFQSLLIGRRTVEEFDHTPVDNDVLERAVQCAIAAPNRSESEPWRFIQVGPETVHKFAQLKQQLHQNMETDVGGSSVVDWTEIPGWCVVTTKLSPNDPAAELEDFKSVSCAVQNFMLSMWSEGIGTKWTSGPVQKTREFAQLCGVDTTQERVAGCIWYGFAREGLVNADPKRRKNTVDDVLSSLP